MRLLWTADQPVPAVRRVLTQRGHDSICAALPADGKWRLGRRFPLLVDGSGAVPDEPLRFFFDVGLIRGSTSSSRTLETYAECLCDWLAFAEHAKLPWRRPTAAMLGTYRDHLLGTIGDPRRSRPLSRRTVNLRLAVAIEFYKHLAESSEHDPASRALLSRRLPLFRRLRVRVDRRRPRALTGHQCSRLCDRLRSVYRLMFQWALCTGLRTASLVSMRLDDFVTLLRARSQRLMRVRAKGGKTIQVQMPQALIEVTARYVEIERVLCARPDRDRLPSALFLNT